MDKFVPLTATPSIYRFGYLTSERVKNLDGFEVEVCPGKWDWHKASELFEAINNALMENGKEKMTAEEVSINFSHLPSIIHGELIIIDGGGISWIAQISRNTWLKKIIEIDGYLPAKIGMQILNEIKHPNIASILIPLLI